MVSAALLRSKNPYLTFADMPSNCSVSRLDYEPGCIRPRCASLGSGSATARTSDLTW